MSTVALVLVVLLGLVSVASLALLALVVRISLRRSRGASAGEAVNHAARDAAAELIAALGSGGDADEVDIAARKLAGLLDLDPASLRRAARSQRR